MSSQNSNEINVAGMAVVFMGVVVAAAFVLIVAVATFLAFVFTILALIAWDRPLKIGSQVFTPAEARAFVYRGLLGAFLAPSFLIFCAAVFGTPLTGDALLWSLIGGYVFGSVGIEWISAEEARNQPVILPQPVYQAPEPPRSLPAPPAPRPPFQYASWDDEDVRS